MHLKSLDIKGFKSFADKTRVLLDNPITGIVGPNGCGKSNIVDAIRWVIGENKIKSLRSDTLGDLVFNGTKNRAAAGMAEVSLTFENTRNLLPTEFSTVTVTRKFFRSGESEYRLNDVVCRLKDIHNLFLDTGVSNDSYAIIELGMVDDIIKDKDGSRRRMLEQAAGISIYKTRKKEAEKKLESTRSDIERIDDLLFEIGNNMRTLEGQSKKAERYLKIKTEYKEISLELARVSLQEFSDRFSDLNEKLASEENKKIKIESEIAGDEAEIETQKLELTKKEQELAQTQRKFNELQNQIRNLESEKKLSAQHLQHLKSREQDLKNHIAQARQQTQTLEESLKDSLGLIENEEKNLNALENGLTGVRQNMDQKRASFDAQKTEIERKRQEVQKAQQEQFGIEKQAAVAETTIKSLQQNITRFQEEKQKRLITLTQLVGEKEQRQRDLQEKEKAYQEFQEKQNQLQKEIETFQIETERLREEENKVNRNLDARQNEYNLIKSLVDNLEGYPGSIKFLKKNKDWGSKAPLLSDIFSVEKAYRVALEAVLDQYLNYYVVADVAEAFRAISLLKANKKGKASFFLLNRLNTQKLETTACPEGIIPALEIVSYEKEFEVLARELLARVWIVQDTDQWQDHNWPEDKICVARDGHILSKGFILSGGSVGAFEGNKIGREKNLIHLAEEIKALNQQVVGLQQQKKEVQTKIFQRQNDLRKIDLNKSLKEINQLQTQVSNFDSRAGFLKQSNEDADRQIQNLRENAQALEKDTGETNEVLAKLQKRLREFQDSLKTANQTFLKAEEEYDRASKKYNEHYLLITRQKGKINQLKQEQGFRSGQIDGLKKQIEDQVKQLTDTSEQISVTSGKLNFGNNELEELLEKKEADGKALSERDHAYYILRNQIQEHEQRIGRQRREKDQAELLVNGLKDKIGEMKVQVAGIKERLQVEFKVILEEILTQERTTEMSIDELNENSEKLRKRLENIGEVNPTAIEAYQEIKLRYDFIQTQKNDLEEAKNTLLDTIAEVENTANTRFRETFDQVRENFIHVFKALFTQEDKADLTLTNPDDMAETNIEIYAQPKGKRPSTLTQLSGGEKTLTSTAYLFAIYLIKPAPFCILDEVDAPLDDSNVEKFTGMIRKFSDNSQFIIITHNKQTMASVDVIYGVTMQEVGVSKIVPVDFRSLN